MDIVLRASAIFLLLFVLLRLFGKRQLGQMTPFEFVALVVLGDFVQQAVTHNDSSVTAATLAVGGNVGECFVKLYFIERACEAQIMALSAGDRLSRPPQGAAELAAEQGGTGLKMAANLLAWPALKRKAYRLDPSFAD